MAVGERAGEAALTLEDRDVAPGSANDEIATEQTRAEALSAGRNVFGARDDIPGIECGSIRGRA
jgi:hypothetical protein